MKAAMPAEPGKAHSPSKYDRLIAAAKAVPPTPTIVVHPCDETSLRGAVDSAAAGIIRPLLVGPERKIRDTASKYGLDISGFEIVNAPHSEAAAAKGNDLPPIRRQKRSGCTFTGGGESKMGPARARALHG